MSKSLLESAPTRSGEGVALDILERLVVSGKVAGGCRLRVIVVLSCMLNLPPSNSPRWGEDLTSPPAGGIERGLVDVVSVIFFPDGGI